MHGKQDLCVIWCTQLDTVHYLTSTVDQKQKQKLKVEVYINNHRSTGWPTLYFLNKGTR